MGKNVKKEYIKRITLLYTSNKQNVTHNYTSILPLKKKKKGKQKKRKGKNLVTCTTEAWSQVKWDCLLSLTSFPDQLFHPKEKSMNVFPGATKINV